MGVASGPILPALSCLLAAWVPDKERGTLGTFVFGGSLVCIATLVVCIRIKQY